jgi:hypothetical protein
MSDTIAMPTTPSCIVPGVQPLLTELRETVAIEFSRAQDPARPSLERFVRDVFKRSFDAELRSFYPNLLAFTTGAWTRGVVGYRDGMVKPLFSEQYLDAPAENVIGVHLGRDIARRQLVEVGNLALAGRGEVRWVIAAMTVFLYAAGYRWVLFTAVKPLYNAFRRLGLKPIDIAKPNPLRLPRGGDEWGSYYQAAPVVCAGDITAGYHKLVSSVSPRQPLLNALLQQAYSLGLNARFGYAGNIDRAG